MFLDLALGGIAGYLAIAVIAVAMARLHAATQVVYGASLLLSLLVLGAALVALLIRAPAETILLPLGLPWIGAHFRLDALAAFFRIVVSLGGAAASLYALGYGRHEAAPHRVLPFYALFLAGMSLVVLADDAFSFLLCWEVMSLASWALVMAHHRDEGNARAGYIYLIMASFGTLALLLGLRTSCRPRWGLWLWRDTRRSARTGAGGDGARARAARRRIESRSRAAACVAAARRIRRHRAMSPALMSGVMTKVAVYAFIRIVFDLLNAPSWWASMIVLALAAATALLGVLYALMQHDLKRLLAYHTVENIGIIFIGLGLALGFRAAGMNAAAALALTAALFHVFNHSLFKSLLFFGTGAVLTQTGERDMEKLGGLIHRMPLASFAFLTGCVAISALPPLNGFVSEWLTFQAILLSPALAAMGPEDLIPASARCWRSRRRWRPHVSSRLSASRSSAARAPPRWRGQGRRIATRLPRCSFSPRSVCSPASSPASSSTRWRRSA